MTALQRHKRLYLYIINLKIQSQQIAGKRKLSSAVDEALCASSTSIEQGFGVSNINEIKKQKGGGEFFNQY